MDLKEFETRLLSEASDAILISDREGVIRFWNDACERVFGFSSTEAVGQSLELIIPENIRERHNRGHDEAMTTGKLHYGPGDLLAVPALHKEGHRISVEFSITPFRDDNGKIVALAAILRDVTEKHEEMKALRKAAASSR